jgi:hypothetical protein
MILLSKNKESVVQVVVPLATDLTYTLADQKYPDIPP